MALLFGANTTDRVVCGSGATLDQLPSGGAMTAAAIVRRTSNGSNQHVVTKDGNFTGGWNLGVDNNAVEGELNFFIFRATSNTQARSNTSNALALNTWSVVAVVFDESAGQRAKLYLSTLDVPIAEVSGYDGVTQNGSGAIGNDSAHDVQVGNLQRSSLPFKGDIAHCGIWNRALTVGELDLFRQYPRLRQAGCVDLLDLTSGASPLADLSGNGNAGTITGATVSVNPPMPRRRVA